MKFLENEYSFDWVTLNHQNNRKINEYRHTVRILIQCINKYSHTYIQLPNIPREIFLTLLKESMSLHQNTGKLCIFNFFIIINVIVVNIYIIVFTIRDELQIINVVNIILVISHLFVSFPEYIKLNNVFLLQNCFVYISWNVHIFHQIVIIFLFLLIWVLWTLNLVFNVSLQSQESLILCLLFNFKFKTDSRIIS